jgi:hypothetical protein
MKLKELHEELTDTYSNTSNYKKAREECNELANAITDYMARPTPLTAQDMIDEAVDVYTMCERIFLINNVTDVKKRQKTKMKRALRRVGEVAE